jgi:hypothetical protein
MGKCKIIVFRLNQNDRGLIIEHIGYTFVSMVPFKIFIFIPPLPGGGGGYTVLPLSILPSKIFFVAFFSGTIDGRNLIFGHKLHIQVGMPYCGKHFGPVRFLLPVCRLSWFLCTLKLDSEITTDLPQVTDKFNVCITYTVLEH